MPRIPIASPRMSAIASPASKAATDGIIEAKTSTKNEMSTKTPIVAMSQFGHVT